jgi:uncharacterized delta-60 repeat protein
MKKLLFLFISLSFFCKAQNPGDIAQNFGAYPGFNDKVNTIAIQSDGKIILGGNFTSYRGQNANRIIRLNPDGTKDNSFLIGNGFDGNVTSIVIQNDGKIIVGGWFTLYNILSSNRIIRLNDDGSKDTSFNVGIGFNNYIKSIILDNNEKIIIGGEFTSYNGQSETRIVRLNSDGSKDISFSTGTGFDGTIYNIAVQNDNKIIVGGIFNNYNLTSATRIIRLNDDGSRDISFNIGTGFGGSVLSIVLQNDGKILVGGNFSSYNGATESNIILLNTDGTKDSSFNTGTGFNFGVNVIKEQVNGKIIIAGDFTTYNSVAQNRIIILNLDGSIDNSFDIGTGFNNSVNAIAVQNNGTIILGGNFNDFNNSAQHNIMFLNTDGTKDINFNAGTGLNNSVNSIAIQNDGKIIIGGYFSIYKEKSQNRITRINIDGSLDTSFNIGTGFNNTVNAIAIQNDGKIIVGGEFLTYKGLTQFRIIRLNTDGSRDISFNIGTGFNGGVLSIALQNDGKILVGGSFSAYKGIPQNNLIRLNPDGSKDTSFNIGTGFAGSVSIIKVQSDGKIIAGGYYSSFNGTTTKGIVRLNADGSRDINFNLGSGFDSYPHDIELQNNGKILVGGVFNFFNGERNNYIIRLNNDGTKDTSFNIGLGFNFHLNTRVNTIAIQNDEKIIIGGDFTSYNEITEKNIIRLNNDGTKDTNFITGTGFNTQVWKIKLLSNDQILIGGPFTDYNGNKESVHLIALQGNTTLSNENFLTSNPISIWPNPTNDFLNINVLGNIFISSVRIYDLQGKLILEDKTTKISVNHLSKGMYLVKVTTEEGEEFIKKFIKE